MRSLIRECNFIKWFYFGMHIKRWLLLLLLGVAIMGLGFGYLLREVYVQYTFPDFVYYITLQFLPALVPRRPLHQRQRRHHLLRRLEAQHVAALRLPPA